MTSDEIQQLADKIEARATDPKAPAFDDLIEENWRVIVAALRSAASAQS